MEKKNPVPVKHSIQVEVERNLRKFLALNSSNIKIKVSPFYFTIQNFPHI